jgi:hypothetical protein
VGDCPGARGDGEDDDAACARRPLHRGWGNGVRGDADRTRRPELRDGAGVDAGTLHALAGVLDRRGGFPRGSVLLLDEAGMAAARITARVFEHAERAGVKVIAVGDAGQLSSVEAGGWFAALTRSRPGPSLREVIRQRDPAERAALAAPTTASQSATSSTRPRRSHCTPANATRPQRSPASGPGSGRSTGRRAW